MNESIFDIQFILDVSFSFSWVFKKFILFVKTHRVVFPFSVGLTDTKCHPKPREASKSFDI